MTKKAFKIENLIVVAMSEDRHYAKTSPAVGFDSLSIDLEKGTWTWTKTACGIRHSGDDKIGKVIHSVPKEGCPIVVVCEMKSMTIKTLDAILAAVQYTIFACGHHDYDE